MMNESIEITGSSGRGRMSPDLSDKHIAIVGCVSAGKTTLVHMLMSRLRLEETNIHFVATTDEIRELPYDVVVIQAMHDEITLPRIEDLITKRDSLESFLPLSRRSLSNFKYKENFLYGNGYHKEWRR